MRSYVGHAATLFEILAFNNCTTLEHRHRTSNLVVELFGTQFVKTARIRLQFIPACLESGGDKGSR